MKRLATMLAILLITLQAMATPVSESAAKSLAEKFLQRPAAAKLTHRGQVPSQTLGKHRIQLKSAAAVEPAYYVFNFNGGGWVIIAGEDSVEPVLAYSKTGYFTLDGAPDNLKWWMEGIAGEIGAIRSGEASPAPVSRKAKIGTRKAGTEVRNHHTAKWDQEAPYNNKCPNNGRTESGSTVNSVTGCVATAGAIVAKFFEWPKSGEGQTEAYSYTSEDTNTKQNIASVSLGHAYDWDNMLDSYSGNYTTAQGDAVATLMADIGKASMMAYNYYAGSGTFDQNLLLAFQKHFKYNKKAYQAPRDGYGDAEWIALLEKELDTHPIVYGGVSGNQGGHEFVFEGYTTDDYFLVNWGWGGDSNGAFTIDRMTLGSYNFADMQSTLIDLVPDENGSTEYADNIVITPYSRYPGLYTTTTNFVRNTTFTVRVSNFYNNATMPFNGKLYIAVYDKNDNWKEDISSAKEITNLENAYINYQRNDSDEDAFCWSYWTNVSCKITGAIKGGDRIRLHYKGQYSEGYARCDDKDGVWEIVISNAAGPDAEEIAAATTFAWNKTTRTISTTTSLDDGISLTVKNAAGKSVYSISSMAKDQDYEINCTGFASGTYSLVYGGGEDYTLTLTL